MSRSKTIITVFIISLVLISTLVSGCMDSSSTSQELQIQEKAATIQITDMAGRTVEVPENVERIVAVGAGTLRQITYFGAMDKVVGVEANEKEATSNAVYTIVNLDKVANLPEVGPSHGGDTELIAGAEPEVIFFGSSAGDVSDAINYQTKTGVPVIYMEGGDLADGERETLYRIWEIYGEVLDKTDRAKELQEYTESLIADLKARTENIPDEEKQSVFAGGLSYRGSFGLLSTQYPFASFDMINAKSAFDENDVGSDIIKTTAFSVSIENMLAWNPDVIFIDMSNFELVANGVDKNPAFQELKALKEGEVYGFMTVSAYARNYENTLINSYYMGTILYPENFSDVETNEKGDEIYEMFLGEKLYDEMTERMGAYKQLDL
ncbi:MAG: ABC transporter substrate-binding protein [Methanolobus sp.]|nr:ABC transporter substrate-binding protein [Methanolobus sp.]